MRRPKKELLNSFCSVFISAAKAMKDPGYAQAIIDGYVRAKLSKGKKLEEVSVGHRRARSALCLSRRALSSDSWLLQVDKKLHDLGKEVHRNKVSFPALLLEPEENKTERAGSDAFTRRVHLQMGPFVEQ